MKMMRKRPRKAGVDHRLAAEDQGTQYQRSVTSLPPSLLDDDLELQPWPTSWPEPRYEAGWCIVNGESPTGTGRQPYAFLRPYHEDWYDMHAAPNWWSAMAKAIELSLSVKQCEFIGQLGDARADATRGSDHG